MRILQLAKFYPPEPGGIESAVRELAAGLNARGLRADVLCAGKSWRSREERGPGGCRIIRAGAVGMLLSTSLSPALVVSLARLAPAYDVVHVHMPNPMAALALWLVRPRARVIVHWHSDVIHQRRALRLFEPLQRWLLSRADRIIATSAGYAAASSALAPWSAKVAVVPLGIGDNSSRSDPGRVTSIRDCYPGKRIVFALGRMTPYKGFEVLIEAAGRLPDDVVVLVGGTGTLLQQHRKRVSALGLDGKVQFLGPIPADDLANYHSAAYVFCMPSLNRAEAFGIVILEAMAAGRPVVCSDVTGSGMGWVNVHGETGLTVAPGSADSLASALNRLLAEPLLAETMGAAGRRRFLSQFTAADMVGAIAATYSELAADPN